MADLPPPPPPAPRPTTRPSVVTAAAVLLIVAGALAVLAGILLLAGGGAVAGVGSLFVIVSIVLLAVGALEIYAGRQVLNLRENGRIIGIVLASINAVFQLLSIGRTPGTAVVSIAISIFIVWALVTNAEYFRS